MTYTSNWGESERRRLLEAVERRGGESISAVCERFGAAVATLYKWKKRRAQGESLLNRSTRPRRLGGGKQQKWEEEVLRLHSRYRVGAGKLRWYLRRQNRGLTLPSESAIHRWLKKAGRVKRRRWRAPPGPKVEQAGRVDPRRCNEVWAIDFKGKFSTLDGRRVNALTVTDVYSRYILAVNTVASLNTHEVKKRMKVLFNTYGLPKVIRVDHGAPFFGPGPRGWTQLSVWWIRLGVQVEYITRNGNASHEQMHRMMKERTANPPAQTLPGQRSRFAWWKKHYNNDRPHDGAGEMPPGSRYRPRKRCPLTPLTELNYPPAWTRLKVNPFGYSQWLRKKRSIGRAFAGQTVGLEACNDGYKVYLGRHLLGTIYPHEPALRPVQVRRGG